MRRCRTFASHRDGRELAFQAAIALLLLWSS